jgi:Protein of unknown function DUF58
MKWKQIKWKIKYAMQYFPFTLNTVLCLLAGWGAFYLLDKKTPKGEEISPLLPFILIMGKVSLWFLAALAGVSILSTFATFFYYLYLKNSKGYKLEVSFTTEAKKGKKSRLYLNARLEGVIRPLLGFIKGRLYYDDNVMTERFGLLSNKRKEQSLWHTAITGRSRMALPDIKEYDLKGGFIYFQDMLQIFSLALAQPIGGHFYQPPVLLKEDDEAVFPKKTETMDVRIEQLRRVEGDPLNYKDFEAGDDVRRIVWKVYAKNRELVVRVPEMYEPYASHLYFYASFYADVKAQWLGEGYLKEMLNYYKNCVWTIYDTLSKKEWEMRLIPDQTFHIPEQLTDDEKSMRIISNSSWHKDTALQQYFNPKSGTVLCVSSLTDTHELRNVLDRCDASTVVYFVKVSKVFKHFAPLSLLSRVIIQPPEDRLSKLRTRWTFSPMRIQVHKREKEIEDILKSSSVTVGVI